MAATNASTEAPGGHGGFPPFQSENFPSQLVWLAVTFVLLYVLMSRIALPRIAGILSDRSKHIADDLAAANRFKEQSDAAHAAYEKALNDARSRAQSIAAATHAEQAAAAEVTNKRLEAQLGCRAINRSHPHRGDEQCRRHCQRHRSCDRRAPDRSGSGRA